MIPPSVANTIPFAIGRRVSPLGKELMLVRTAKKVVEQRKSNRTEAIAYRLALLFCFRQFVGAFILYF